MRQKKVKLLRKEAIKYIGENKVRFPIANYTSRPWSNRYKNFIKKFRSNI